ncbi:MAG: pseudouridine synthase, partial [Pseudomonadota bacterium]
TEETIQPLLRGIELEGERFQPMQVAIDRQQGANAWLTVGLREGRNREIRRAMEAIGLGVNRLIRVSYGPFQLGDLAAGGVEEVKARVLADQLGLRRPSAKGTERAATEGSRRAAKPGPGRGPRSTPRPARSR